MASAPLIPTEQPMYRRSVDSTTDEITPCSPELRETTPLERHPSQENDSSKASTHDEAAAPSAAVPARKLEYFPTVFRLALLYSTLAAFAWTMTCVLVHRPATRDHYGLDLGEEDYRIPRNYAKISASLRNERWFQATRIIQAIVAVSTLPLASAVCSNAAVVFTQRRCKDRKFSLRQTMVLADKGWMDIEVYMKLMRGHWERYGCTFLHIAIALMVMGAIISPLQSVFLKTVAVHTPGYLGQATRLTDIPDRFSSPRWSETQVRRNDQDGVAQLRSAMSSTAVTDPQSRLWSHTGTMRCNESSVSCAFGQPSLANMSKIQDPFLAQLPAGFNTGLIRQFLPRINSSVKRVAIDANEYPVDCHADESSFHSNYAADFIRELDASVGQGFKLKLYDSYKYFLSTCMPGNQTRSPWQSTHQRQGFSETLYLNITTYYSDSGWYRGYFKITVDTTAGYFELPNYMNGQLPGPLLAEGPEMYCGRDCIRQGPRHADAGWGNYTLSLESGSNKRRQTYPSYEDNNATADIGSFGFFQMANKGPLLTIALALFGPGSYITERNSRPEAFIDKNITRSQSESTCVERMPFVGLLDILNPEIDPDDPWRVYNSTTYADNYQLCSTVHHKDLESLTAEVRAYVLVFAVLDDIGSTSTYTARLENALEAAVFLANQVWLTSSLNSTLSVHYDLGTTIQAPYISSVGIVLLSALLGIYIASLLSMATYSIWDPHWTGRLDSFAVLRLGAAVAAHFPLQENNVDKMEVLDETPGWVGDTMEGQGECGELGLGGATQLRARRRYRCSDLHDEPILPYRVCINGVMEFKPPFHTAQGTTYPSSYSI